jgi:hypothetical protein
MDTNLTNSTQMSEIEADTRRFGDSLPNDLTPGGLGNGWMVWDDDDHCIYLDFFGEFGPAERSRAASVALETYHGLQLPHSLRIGFHPSEEIARRTLDEWFGYDDGEIDQGESSEPQLNEPESKMG